MLCLSQGDAMSNDNDQEQGESKVEVGKVGHWSEDEEEEDFEMSPEEETVS